MVKLIEPDWNRFLKHPMIIIILGAKRSGKSSLGCLFLNHFHEQGLNCFAIGGRKIRKAFPKWVRNVSPTRLNFKNNSVVLGMDMHLYAYAREWFKEPNKIIDFFGRESGHKDITFIYDTQQSIVLDRNIFSIVDMLCVKKPSLFQVNFSRVEIRKQMEFINEEYKKLIKKLPEADIRQYVYILTDHQGEYMVGTFGKASWFNEDISKIYRDASFSFKKSKEWTDEFGKF